jgi:hypothetical protein
MKHIKQIFLAVCSLLAVNIASAQFSVYGTGGMSGINYKTDGGTVKSGIGFGGGLGYSHAISPVFKIGAALELSMYNSKVSFAELSETYVHGDGEYKFLLSYTLYDYEERQNITMLTVPLTVRYQTDSYISFCLSGGIKLGLPVSARASIAPRELSASGDYEYEGQQYTDLSHHGFPGDIRRLELPATKNSIEMGLSVAATLEAGLLFEKFYIGLYCDYGLNDMRKTKNKHPLEYVDLGSSIYEFSHNSILNSSLVDKLNLYSIGLKASFVF